MASSYEKILRQQNAELQRALARMSAELDRMRAQSPRESSGKARKKRTKKVKP
jgi:vacuolar-type H+-ATPase subunit E/Vma4